MQKDQIGPGLRFSLHIIVSYCLSSLHKTENNNETEQNQAPNKKEARTTAQPMALYRK